MHNPTSFPPVPAAWAWAIPALALGGALLVALSGTNLDLFLALNRLSEYTGTVWWASLTIGGDTVVALALCLLFAGRRPDIVWAALLAAVLSAVLVHGLKPLLDIPRPPAVLPSDSFHLIGPVLRQRSFPSGHTATAFTLAGVIILNLSAAARLRWGWLVLGWAVLVGVSRAAVGVHWPLDILAGTAYGWIGAVGGSAWMRRWQWGLSLQGQRWSTAFLTLAAVSLLFYDTRYPQARGLQYAIAVAALAATGLAWKGGKWRAVSG